MAQASVDGHGLWLGDTRFLSEYHLLVNGRRTEPERLDTHAGGGTWHLRSGPFTITCERYLASGMHERITIANGNGGAESGELGFVLRRGLAAMLAGRGYGRAAQPPPAQLAVSG